MITLKQILFQRCWFTEKQYETFVRICENTNANRIIYMGTTFNVKYAKHLLAKEVNSSPLK